MLNFRSIFTLLAGLTFLASGNTASAEPTSLTLTANDVDYAFSIQVPADWTLAPKTFENALSFSGPASSATGEPTGQLQIYVEPRLNHQGALTQIRELTAGVAAAAKTVSSVGGWAALQTEQLETRPQPSQGTPYSDPEVLRIRVYIAVGDTLYVATGTFPADANPDLVQSVIDMTSSLEFQAGGGADQLDLDLEFLQQSTGGNEGAAVKTDEAASLQTLAGVSSMATTGESLAVQSPVGPGADIRIDAAGRGELEIAVSPNGSNVVVALQSRRVVSSNDGGANFPTTLTVGAGNGDPSVAYGQSGNFYVAWIDTNCGTAYSTFNVGNLPAQPFGYDCTGIARSTDNGVTFPTNTVNPAVVCIGRAPAGMMDPAGACFPDQEHIGADRVNAGSGGDQVYSTWRNFNAANQDAGLVCSQDSGVTWTAPITLGASSFFPRITVGQDGFVYVAAYGGGNHRLWKYSSCASGLNLQAGFPVNVAARSPYVCPFAGHDRCDQNPTSQTVAVDDTNPNHIYYAFGQDDAEAVNSYSTIIVRDSLDGGMTWLAGRVVQANPPSNARRIMPWLSATGGDAVLTWYEQAAAVPSDSTNHVGSRVALDLANNLTFRGAFTISDVPDNWCNSGWDCGTRVAPGASESCPNQPQLAGFCGDGVAGTPDSNIRCDFSDESTTPGTYCLQPNPASGNNEVCRAGNGCPKYGDYNGNASVGTQLFAAWPSASAPAGVPLPNTATNTGVLYETIDLPGAITIVKTIDAEPDGDFNDDPTGWTFDIVDDGEASRTTDNTGTFIQGVDPDTYTVNETDPPPGDTGLWLVTASCTDDDTSNNVGVGVTDQLFNSSLPDVSVTGVTITAQQDVTCTFANQRMAGFLTGGGNIRQGRRRNGAFVSFGGNVGVALDGGLHGQWQTNLHNVGNNNLDGEAFHSLSIESVVFGTNPGEPADPPEAVFNTVNFTMIGRLNGLVCTLEVHGTDHGEPARGRNAGNDSDSIRFQLDCPGTTHDYDSFGSGDFNEQESIGLHNLDGGNLQIHPPEG
jgi:hypothetical protein